jgi:hypothetical protein
MTQCYALNFGTFIYFHFLLLEYGLNQCFPKVFCEVKIRVPQRIPLQHMGRSADDETGLAT